MTRSAGRIGEFLLVGGATIFFVPIAWLLRGFVEIDDATLWVSGSAFYAAHVINDPHFSVTYLLFYRKARDRAFGADYSVGQRLRYWVAGAFVPLALTAWAVHAVSSESPFGLGLLFQLMFLLVGWHYVKQGFGVFTVLSARRGVRYDPLERRVVLGHCLAGWFYAWSSPADPGRPVTESGVFYFTFAHPPGLEAATGIVFAVSAIALVGVLARKWRRERRLGVTPLVGLLASVWVWTVFGANDPLLVFWIPALHSLQYLYFVGLLKRNEARAEQGPPRFGRPVPLRLLVLAASALGIGWVVFRGGPQWLDAQWSTPGSALGPTPYFAAIFAVVNLHHYFMDAVIWRRDNPETRHLLA